MSNGAGCDTATRYRSVTAIDINITGTRTKYAPMSGCIAYACCILHFYYSSTE